MKEQKMGFLSLVVFILTIYVLIAILVDTFFVLPAETSRVLELVDNGVCIFFLFEFCIRFFQAENKLAFMKWGWIDLVASVPTVSYFRAGRLFRLVRLLRIIRAFRTTKDFVHHIFRNKAEGTFTTVAILAVLLIIFSAIGILQVEKEPSSNIKTAEDAIWWAYTTITTVGYGDKYPVTTEGRIIGMVLMTAGVGVFGTFSGFVASWFVSGNKKEEDNTAEKKD